MRVHLLKPNVMTNRRVYSMQRIATRRLLGACDNGIISGSILLGGRMPFELVFWTP
uniref:Uncharacterized protein n=1 Tax=Triticum urartu TaxID=4572 RepID=A0A8R7TN29_TRIUA